jgi:pentatricopeptide repeat protein
VTVAAVLTGWSQVGTWEAAERAERILRQLLPQMGLRPDVVTYSTCLACWAKIRPVASNSKSPSPSRRQQGPRGTARNTPHQANAMERAQSLFDELQEKHPEIQADVVTYTNLMNVYARHGKAERVESILQDLLQAYQATTSNHQPDTRLKPNVHTFSVVVSAWSRSPRADGARRAQEWLHRMSNEFGVTPNVVTYTTVLNAWSQRAKTDPRAPDRARELLTQMEASPDPSLQPNGISYTAVLRGYAQQGRAKDAETLLEIILANNNHQPDVYTFSAVLQAWTKARDCSPIEAAQRAEALLMRMHDLYYDSQTNDDETSQGGSSDLQRQLLVREPPNVVCFSNVLVCWSRVPEGAERAEAILQAMETYGVSPNLVSINIVMNAWANQARNDNAAVGRARVLLDEVLKKKNDSASHPKTTSKNNGGPVNRTTIRPDEYTYRAMFKGILSSTLPNRLELAHNLLDEMTKEGIRPSAYMMERLKEMTRK